MSFKSVDEQINLLIEIRERLGGQIVQFPGEPDMLTLSFGEFEVLHPVEGGYDVWKRHFGDSKPVKFNLSKDEVISLLKEDK